MIYTHSNNALFFSGWGQPNASFLPVMPDIHTVEYMRQPSLEAVFSSLPPLICDTVIGWSLGGQLAIRAIARGVLNPKRLVLIATPYRFDHPDFTTLYQGMADHPQETLKRFTFLMCKGDSKAKPLLRSLGPTTTCQDGYHYRYWLNELHNFDCSNIDFSYFPSTLILHGEQDAIVPVEESLRLQQAIPQAKRILFPQAGHIPHLHNGAETKQFIEDWLLD